MLCNNCKENPANTHIKRVIGGKLVEYYLCSECAEKLGYKLGLSSLIDAFMPLATNKYENRCKGCGSTFNEIISEGKVGCPQCYEAFHSQLIPSIQKIHGTAEHKGKTPGRSALVPVKNNTSMAVTKTDELKNKKLKLNIAIQEQRFEDAAVLRDEILELKKGELG